MFKTLAVSPTLGALSICRRRLLVVSTAAFLFVSLYLSLHEFHLPGLRAFLDESNLDENVRGGSEQHVIESIPTSSTLSPETTTSIGPVETLEISSSSTPDKVIVVASTKSDDTSWVGENFPDWQHAIYVVDDHDAPLHTTINKGNEANVYLTYLIANYDNLPSTIVFSHDHRTHHHGSRSVSAPTLPQRRSSSQDTKALDFDNVATIRALNLSFVQSNGYANLRCVQHPGCPSGLRPFRTPTLFDRMSPQEKAMPAAWFEIFGNNDVPEVLAAPCCAQFAVSRDQVLSRGKREYERMLWWLEDTPLNDYTSGRVFEFLWHVIFGQDPVYCPNTQMCYKQQYNFATA